MGPAYHIANHYLRASIEGAGTGRTRKNHLKSQVHAFARVMSIVPLCSRQMEFREDSFPAPQAHPNVCHVSHVYLIICRTLIGVLTPQRPLRQQPRQLLCRRGR